jgi:adenine-specific DNA-methyltransferase
MSADTPALRKARGAFFTPPELCEFVADWAIRQPSDRVLEPSCGEAAFLLALGERLRDLGAPGMLADQLHGVELHESSAQRALDLLGTEGMAATIANTDFFDFQACPKYDVVAGNPPYIRYQNFSGPARAKSREAAFAGGVKLSGLASSWASFVIQATKFLKPDGRLGLVLPAELLTVNYAAGIRRFLLEKFANVRLILFSRRVFPGVLEEVVLLLAEGSGPTRHFETQQVESLVDLRSPDSLISTWSPPDIGGKWIPALLSADATASYKEVTEGEGFGLLSDWGTVYLGAVTGNNRYFTLTTAEAESLELKRQDLLRISPPGSQHLRGLTFSESAWREMAEHEKRTYLFYPASDPLSQAARKYIDYGEAQGVQNAYKCRVRKPWWRVPGVKVPDLFLTYMNHDTPRLCANLARVPHLNSVHGVELRPKLRQEGTGSLPVASLNSVTMLGAEIVGRAYGGGMLKLEPKEATLLPLPSAKLVSEAASKLRSIESQLVTFLRNGNVEGAASVVDRVLLIETLGMRRPTVRLLREARYFLFERRRARASKK